MEKRENVDAPVPSLTHLEYKKNTRLDLIAQKFVPSSISNRHLRNPGLRILNIFRQRSSCRTFIRRANWTLILKAVENLDSPEVQLNKLQANLRLNLYLPPFHCFVLNSLNSSQLKCLARFNGSLNKFVKLNCHSIVNFIAKSEVPQSCHNITSRKSRLEK